jgi:photosystem II stability/assembly factor-like uncharacterized protein
MINKKYSLGFLFLVISLWSASYGYNYHGCAMAPNSDQGWVVTIETTLVNHTWDGGESWELQQILTSRDFFDIFFLDTLNGWTANRLAMIWHTSNGGLNWSWQSLGMSKFGTRVFFLDTLHGWVAAGEGICIRTTDGGNYWQQVIINYLPLDTVDFYGVSFTDTLHGWMVAGRYPEVDSLGVHFKKGQGFIVYSNNGGDTSSWITQRHDAIYDFFDVKFKDTLEGWVVGGEDSMMGACVLHTTNGGHDWSLLAVPSSAKYLRALELVDGNKLWAVGRSGTIIYSSNGGNTWEVQSSSTDTTLFDVDFADSLRGLIAGNGIVLYTRDGGRNWLRSDISGFAEKEISNSIPVHSLNAFPNPFVKTTTINMPKLLSSHSELRIYDALGNLITSHRLSTISPNFTWDGRDKQGKEVRPGIYFVMVRQASTQKLRLVKIN